MQRRSFLKGAAGAAGAAAAALGAAPALAASYITGQNGNYSSSYTAGSSAAWTGWTSPGGVGYSFVYMYSGPSSGSTWLASIPINQAVTVVAYAPGEILAPPNPIWYNVVAPQGSGWVYSGLVTEIEPVTLPAAAVAPPPGPIPPPVGWGRSIGVSLSRQQLFAYEGGSIVFQTDVTTGMPAKPTPTGLYYIQRKIPNFKFISPFPVGSPYWYPDSPTNYALQFRTDGYYIHDAPWRLYNGPGTNLPHMDPDGTIRAGSHGCINTQYGPIMYLVSFTSLGTPVLIID